MVFDLIGYAGVLLYITSYALLSFNKIKGDSLKYHFLNLIAPVCVLISLSNSFNAPSAVIQTIWVVLSIFAIFRIMQKGATES